MDPRAHDFHGIAQALGWPWTIGGGSYQLISQFRWVGSGVGVVMRRHGVGEVEKGLRSQAPGSPLTTGCGSHRPDPDGDSLVGVVRVEFLDPTWK